MNSELLNKIKKEIMPIYLDFRTKILEDLSKNREIYTGNLNLDSNLEFISFYITVRNNYEYTFEQNKQIFIEIENFLKKYKVLDTKIHLPTNYTTTIISKLELPEEAQQIITFYKFGLL
jgi:hypothetical protein